ncbi:MAG TPA: putative inorganic carbon transporter subunit DabA, partial [Polyangiaceae bacterium]
MDVRPGFDLDAALSRVARWLPTQGPIKDFVHHNTLHALQATSFHEAVAAAASVYGARRGMSLAFFVDAYRDGRISDSALDRALAGRFPEGEARSAARATLFTSAPAVDVAARSGLRALWTERLGGVPLHRRSHLHLYRLFGSYLDQGLSTWRMPDAERVGLYECVARLAADSALPLIPFHTSGARALLALPARDAIAKALAKTVGREESYETYLLETLLAVRGWSGLIGECERNPNLLLEHRDVTLLDCAAVTLVAELGCLEHELGEDFAPLAPSVSSSPRARTDAVPEDVRLQIWQEAFEWSYDEPLLGALTENARRASHAPRASKVWAVFCLDDRSCSVRRHLEEIAPEVATFGTAGFFGLDFFYRGASDAVAGKQCPAPITPHHLIVEREAAAGAQPSSPPWWRRALHLESDTNTLVRGWFLSYALGIGAAARLA